VIIDVDPATNAVEVLGDLDAGTDSVVRGLQKSEHEAVCEAVPKRNTRFDQNKYDNERRAGA
jgi:hypothetical protein